MPASGLASMLRQGLHKVSLSVTRLTPGSDTRNDVQTFFSKDASQVIGVITRHGPLSAM